MCAKAPKEMTRKRLLPLWTIILVLIGVSPAVAQIRPEAATIDLAPRELVDRLRADPYAYFRFVNRPWIARVCEEFADEVGALPIVRLHGDAHVEQFGVTSEAWGLDDFDDSEQGSALIDIVRFLGSVDLVLRQRGWTGERETLFDRFFAGYRNGLTDPQLQPPRPMIVNRIRAGTPRSRLEFLSWGEALMRPMEGPALEAVVAGLRAVEPLVAAQRRDLPPGYLTVIRAGWLQMGVGSAVVPKILIRVQGVSKAPDDDVLVEAKQARNLDGLRCRETPPSVQPTLRVVLGATQLGRLKPNILVAGPTLVIPELVARGKELRQWWLRSWDPSYRELHVADLRSARDLAAVGYDAGVQLGAGGMKEVSGVARSGDRRRMLALLKQLEPRIRERTGGLVDDLLKGWNELRAQ